MTRERIIRHLRRKSSQLEDLTDEAELLVSALRENEFETDSAECIAFWHEEALQAIAAHINDMKEHLE